MMTVQDVDNDLDTPIHYLTKFSNNFVLRKNSYKFKR